MSFSLRSADNVGSARVPGVKDELLYAKSNNFVLLRPLEWDQLTELVHQYADEHDAALTTYFLTPSGKLRKGSKPGASRELKIANLKSPEALCIQLIGSAAGGGTKQVQGRYCSTTALSETLRDLGLLEGYSSLPRTYTPAWRVVEDTSKSQRRVANALLAGKIRSMEWTNSRCGLDRIASKSVIKLLDDAKSVDAFFQGLAQTLLDWLNDPIRKGAHGTRSSLHDRPLALAWFATWLAERGILLFPLLVVGRGQEFYPVRYRHFLDEWICPVRDLRRRKAHRDAVIETYAESELGLEDRAWLLLQTLNLVAPGATLGRVSAASIDIVKRKAQNLFREQVKVLSSVWRIEMARQRELGVPAKEIQEQADLVLQWNAVTRSRESPLWDWVDNPDAFIPLSAIHARRAETIHPHLKSNVAELRRVFAAVAGNSAPTIASRLTIWCSYLSSLPGDAVPRTVLDIKPAHMEPMSSDQGFKSLREFMTSRELSKQLQSAVFASVRNTWKVVAQQDGIPLSLCPVMDVGLYTKSKRGGRVRPASTTRRAIDMEVLELLIEENQRNEYEFSRQRTHPSGELLDYRHVVEPDSGKWRRIWWPGLAVLMDLLLQIPIRHKQGRYLDSGEGDELCLDIDSLEQSQNTLRSATRGRSEAFIQRISLSPVRNEPGLGMFVNTNKTGREYVFPWLQREIAVSVRSVIEWQMMYNPMSEPVSDRPDNKAERAAESEVTLVFPIFRDPARPDGSPVSATIVLDYFRALMRKVEAKYNLVNHTSLSFFRPNGEPVFDIHSLRVTGVTRLLGLGVDPKIVRLLVGHSSLVMTWYYDHISNERVSAAIQGALERSRPSREALLEMSVQERERYLNRLLGRGEDQSLAISLLRDTVEERSPLLDVRVDGFCPGMKCSDAGVWRPRACSLCKYFSTGPAFLAGLELRLNGLMAELILQQQTLANLREKLFVRRAEGGSTSTLSAEIATREEVIDNILSEWEAQFQYVKRAEAGLQSWLDDRPESSEASIGLGALALFAQSPSSVGLAIQEAHHLVLFTKLIEGAKRIDGFAPTVGAREARDAILLEIVRHEDKSALFFRLDQKLRREALDQFALFLLEQDLPSDEIEELVQGTRSLRHVAGAEAWLIRLTSPSVSEDKKKEPVR